MMIHLRDGRRVRTEDAPAFRGRSILCADGVIRGEHGILTRAGRLVVGYVVSGEFYQRGAYCPERGGKV